MRNSLTIALILTLTVPAAMPFAGALHPVALPGEETATVTLELDAGTYPSATLAESKTCEVTVPAHATVSSVLDKATLDGCIVGWTWTLYASSVIAGQGRFVTGVDGRLANCDAWVTWLVGIDPPVCTYWTYDVNGETAPLGVDNQPVTHGDTYTFVHHVITATPLP